jgi:BirA family transcriptional regulator, biotin operon repressor / biotin---[acetyl-CoA-carboxylase] ligase
MPASNCTFNILNSVDSTNNYAMAKVHAGLANHGDAWFALQQTSGKGQRGKKWMTGNGDNIALSIVLKPAPLFISMQFRLSAAVALACHKFFSKYAGEATSIKWPNDIYWRDRKAGGILIENVIGPAAPSTDSSWKYAVVGIGFNINQTSFEPSLANPVSLKQVTGRQYVPVILAKELLQLVLEYAELACNEPFDILLEQYNQLLYKKNQVVQFKKNDTELNCTVKAVTADGKLHCIHQTDEYFNFGEIEWLL